MRQSGVLFKDDTPALQAMSKLTHLDEQGRARMVDVSAKQVTDRSATARGVLRTTPGTLVRILEGDLPKGDVLAVARTAGIMAAKRTSDLIPLCHPLPLAAVEVHFAACGEDALEILATVRVTSRTGAEMEALTAVAVAGLTVYDMCKAVDRAMTLTDVSLVSKSGGQSGDYKSAP
ncbi:MAG: cyclic pyranopterin phosphate synthase [Hyphomicrobiaceae bacterium]